MGTQACIYATDIISFVFDFYFYFFVCERRCGEEGALSVFFASVLLFFYFFFFK